MNIYSQCVYDADNHYVNLDIRPVYDGEAFMLTLIETSNDRESDTEIEMYLTKEDLKTVINRLTKVLDK